MDKMIVVDTSVFVAAILGPDGSSRKVIRGCLEKCLTPLMGAALYNEYESLLSRQELFKDCLITTNERSALLDAFLSTCRWINVYYLWRPNLRDEADNHLIELAVAGNANSVITHNIKDLNSGELLFPHIRILKPNELLGEIKWQR